MDAIATEVRCECGSSCIACFKEAEVRNEEALTALCLNCHVDITNLLSNEDKLELYVRTRDTLKVTEEDARFLHLIWENLILPYDFGR